MLKLPQKYREKEILYRRLILFTLSLGLLVVYAAQIFDFISKAIWICLPFIIGGILAFVLNTFTKVLMRFGDKVFKIKNNQKYQSAYKILALLLIGSFLILLIGSIIPQLTDSAQSIAKSLPNYIQDTYYMLLDASKPVAFVHNWLENNREAFEDAPMLLARLASFLFAGSASNAFASFSDVISNTFSWLWIAFLSIMFSIIAFFNTKNFVRETSLIARAYMPAKMYEQAHYLVDLVARIFSQYLGGTVLECIILASLVSIFGLLFGIPSAVLCGVFCGICALVPMFGAICGALVCTLFIFMISPGKALTFIIMFICIQQVEGNFIYPNVVGKSTGLPPMFVVVSITIGASLAGVLGMVIFIPIASVLYALIMNEAKTRIEEKGDSFKKDAPVKDLSQPDNQNQNPQEISK